MRFLEDLQARLYPKKYRDIFLEEYDFPTINRMTSSDCALVLTGAASPTPDSVVVAYKIAPIDRPLIMRGWHVPVQTPPSNGTMMRLVLMAADSSTKLPTTRYAPTNSGWFSVQAADVTVGDAGGDNHKQVLLSAKVAIEPGLYIIGIASTSPASGGAFRGRSNRDVIKGRRNMQYTAATVLNANYAAYDIPESPGAANLAAAGDATNANIGVRILCSRSLGGPVTLI